MGNRRFWNIIATIRLILYLVVLLAIIIAIVFAANSI